MNRSRVTTIALAGLLAITAAWVGWQLSRETGLRRELARQRRVTQLNELKWKQLRLGNQALGRAGDGIRRPAKIRGQPDSNLRKLGAAGSRTQKLLLAHPEIQQRLDQYRLAQTKAELRRRFGLGSLHLTQAQEEALAKIWLGHLPLPPLELQVDGADYRFPFEPVSGPLDRAELVSALGGEQTCQKYDELVWNFVQHGAATQLALMETQSGSALTSEQSLILSQLFIASRPDQTPATGALINWEPLLAAAQKILSPAQCSVLDDLRSQLLFAQDLRAADRQR